MLRDAAKADAYQRSRQAPSMSVAEIEAALRGGLPTSHRLPSGIPGWEGLGVAAAANLLGAGVGPFGAPPPAGATPPSDGKLTPTTNAWSCPGSGESCDPPHSKARKISNLVPSSHVNVDRCDEDLAEIVQLAWAMLHTNRDLLDWASCVVFGADDAEIIGNFVDALWPFRIDVVSEDKLINDANGDDLCQTVGAVMLGIPVDRIEVCRVAPIVKEWIDVWKCGNEPERTCVLFDVATILAHELAHVALLAGPDLFDEDCLDSYVFENTFRWALFQRYPGAAGAACCGSIKDSLDNMYLSDTNFGMALGLCKSECAGTGSGGIHPPGDIWVPETIRWDALPADDFGRYRQYLDTLYDPRYEIS